MTDSTIHRLFLDYRERHAYFGRSQAMLTFDEFVTREDERRELLTKGETRTDDEEARLAELEVELLHD